MTSGPATLLSLVASVCLAVAACGGSDAAAPDAPATDPATTEPVVTDPATTEPVVTESVVTEPVVTEPVVTEPVVTEPVVTEPVGAASPWIEVVPESEDCACSDGSEFSFFERPGDPEKVMFYLQGGGACFSEATCDPSGSPTYSTIVTETVESLMEVAGILDPDHPENPLADYSVVYVPYCTGDVHLGNTTTEYSPDVVIEHRGAANAAAALDHLVATYPDATEVFVTGSSAGSVPTPLVGALAADRLPAARVTTFGDSSGAYPDVPEVNELIGTLWGTTNAIPEWPVNAGLTPAEWSFPGLYVQSGRHDPDITFARFDYAFDDVQASFAALAGIGADRVVDQIDATEAQVEAAGIPLATYVAPGTEHVVAVRPEVFDMEVEGVRLIEWITELVEGRTPADVHCVECTT